MDVAAVLMMAQQMFMGYNFDDNDDIDDLLQIVLKSNSKRDLLPKIDDFFEITVPAFSALEFKSHFRMLPSTFEHVAQLISPRLVRETSGSEAINPEKQILITLWRLSTPDSYRSIRSRFGVGKGTSVRAVNRVVKALCGLSQQVIQWPTGDRVAQVVEGFSRAGAFPRTIGAVDGTHIYIPAPKENPECYVNRKGRHSIQAQLVCDHQRIITHVHVGQVGSVHDARVFRVSSLYGFMNDDTRFPNDTHLIGDAAYPLMNSLMVPYSDNGHLTQRQKNFNFCLSSFRMVIERTNALLKLRWRCLHDRLATFKVEKAAYSIMACCVLHNICLLTNDELEEAVIANNPLPVPENAQQGIHNRRQAEAKRDLICTSLRMRNI